MTTRAKKFKLSEKKLDELIVYIAQKTAQEPKFGRTNLNKVLAFSDLYYYANYGHPITGATYIRKDNGPVLKNYQTVLRNLRTNNAVAEQAVPNINYPTMKPIALREPDLTEFSGQEIDFVDQIIRVIKNKKARDSSAISHDLLFGWHATENHDEIPYETVFLPVEYSPTKSDTDYTEQLSERLNWKKTYGTVG